MNKKDNPRSRFAQMMLLRAGSTIASNGSSERSTPSVPYEAVAAASRNWLLIPVVRGIANQPIGIDRATSDLIKLNEWANGFPGCRWAVLTGAQSGVVALEADAYVGLATAQALADMECVLRPSAPTLAGRCWHSFAFLQIFGFEKRERSNWRQGS